jgi:hypothetical protein
MTQYTNDDDGFDEPMPEFEPDMEPEPRRRGRWLLAAAIVLVAAGGLGGVVWYAYKAGLREGESGAVPVITAEIGDSKIKPDDPGGMIVPHQDITAFERLDRSAVAPPPPTVQALRPAAEEPLPREEPAEGAEPVMAPTQTTPELPHGVPSDAMMAHGPEELLPAPEAVAPAEPTVEALLAESEANNPAAPAPVTPPAERAPGPPLTPQELAARPQAAPALPIDATPLPPAVVPPPPAEPIPMPAPVIVAEAAPAAPVPVPAPVSPPKIVAPEPVVSAPTPKAVVDKPPASATKLTPPPAKPAAAAAKTSAPPAPPAAGGVRVQLGSLQNAAAAQSEWRRLSRKFPDELGGLRLTVEAVEIAGKGTYHRIQAGPLAEDRAREICATLTAQKAPCIVVRR